MAPEHRGVVGETAKPMLAILLGVESVQRSQESEYPLGAIFATCGGRVLGGASDFIAEVARGIPTATIEVWWAAATGAPVRVLQSIGMMRSAVARVNDDLYATRLAELLLRAAHRVATTSDSLEVVHRSAQGAGEGDPTPPAVDVLSSAATRDAARGCSALESIDAWRLLVRRARTSFAGRRFAHCWGLGYRRSGNETAIEAFQSVSESDWLTPPPRVTWADPFPVHTEGVDLLFFEEQPHPNAPGQLRCAELFGDGRLGKPVLILESATHLSYPNVFRWEDTWFMVPESAAQGVVSLYRGADFPFRWQHECDLIRGEALVDATLLEHGGHWYLVATRVGADAIAFEDLVCYTAPTLTGPWQPHLGNPVVSDAYRGRPAGQFLREAGMLLRPAQDSSVTYGHGLSLQHITALSERTFAERTLVHRTADWAPDLNGLHTFNRSATLTCIDVARRVRR